MWCPAVTMYCVKTLFIKVTLGDIKAAFSSPTKTSQPGEQVMEVINCFILFLIVLYHIRSALGKFDFYVLWLPVL